jgi:citrate lyase subunit beta / citryl-CoA lyase
MNRTRRAGGIQLSTPGSSEKMIQKAADSQTDHVFLDPTSTLATYLSKKDTAEARFAW